MFCLSSTSTTLLTTLWACIFCRGLITTQEREETREGASILLIASATCVIRDCVLVYGLGERTSRANDGLCLLQYLPVSADCGDLGPRYAVEG